MLFVFRVPLFSHKLTPVVHYCGEGSTPNVKSTATISWLFSYYEQNVQNCKRSQPADFMIFTLMNEPTALPVHS